MKYKEGHRVAGTRRRIGEKLLILLALCSLAALSGATATVASAANEAAAQPKSGIRIIDEDGDSMTVPGDHSAGSATPDTKGEAARTKPAMPEDADSGSPEPSRQPPAPGCPYVDQPLSLIV